MPSQSVDQILLRIRIDSCLSTANLTPATGTVTFKDGTTPIGTTPVSSKAVEHKVLTPGTGTAAALRWSPPASSPPARWPAAKVAAVTPSQVKGAASTLLGSENSVIAVVGDWAKVKSQLTAYTNITFLDTDGKTIPAPQ